VTCPDVADGHSAFHQLTSLATAIAALAVALYGCNLVLCALRWRAALWALGTPMGFRHGNRGYAVQRLRQ
jgi:hypothetical protein